MVFPKFCKRLKDTGRLVRRFIHDHHRYKQSKYNPSLYVPEVFDDIETDDLKCYSVSQKEYFNSNPR